MEVTLPADLRKQVEQELASGRYQSSDELIEEAVRHSSRIRSISIVTGISCNNPSASVHECSVGRRASGFVQVGQHPPPFRRPLIRTQYAALSR